MSETETPRTAEQFAEELGNRAFDFGQDETPSQARLDRHKAAVNKAEKDVIERITTLERELAAMTAAKAHIESSLAAVTAERDTLRRDHNGCALWAEAARRERDRLKAELAAMTAAKELVERQVAVLCARIDSVTFGSTICSNCPSRDRCSLTGCKDEMAAWSRAEAEGGKG